MGIVTTFLAIPLLTILGLPGAVAHTRPYLPHVRARHDGLKPILREAIEKSATTRRLVATLDASDVIVYLELQPDMPDSLHAGVRYAGSGGQFRYLRISLNPMNTRAEMLAMIGHELQHAVEIAGEPGIRSASDLSRHYKRIGLMGRRGETWDTQAARDAGMRVAREIEGR
jgi:hypothetical protein